MKLSTFSIFVAMSLLAAPAAQAQLAPAGANGITVIGRGTVRVHADELRFSAVVFTNQPRVASADVDSATDAIAKALRDGGVADATAGFMGTPNTVGPRAVTGSIHHPTREGIDQLLKRGSAAAAAFPSVVLQNLNLSFQVDDCSEPEMRAQLAAFADARARAERVARAAGIHLGAVINVNETAASGPNGPNGLNGAYACATRPDTQPPFGQSLNYGTDATTLGDVFVTVSAGVTYAIVR